MAISAKHLDPGCLKVTGERQKGCTDRRFLDCNAGTPTYEKTMPEKASEIGLSRPKKGRFLKRLFDLAINVSSSTRYWEKS